MIVSFAGVQRLICSYFWFKDAAHCHSCDLHAVTFLIPLLGSGKLACHYNLGASAGVPHSCCRGFRSKRLHTKANWSVLGLREQHSLKSASLNQSSLVNQAAGVFLFLKSDTLKVSAHPLTFLSTVQMLIHPVPSGENSYSAAVVLANRAMR